MNKKIDQSEASAVHQSFRSFRSILQNTTSTLPTAVIAARRNTARGTLQVKGQRGRRLMTRTGEWELAKNR
jgi:DNA-binding LacI/PurR family transcriptional regulator